MADLAGRQFIAGVAVGAHGPADGAGVDGHVQAKPGDNHLVIGCIGLNVSAEAGALGDAQPGSNQRRHGGKPLNERPRDAVAPVGGKPEAGEIVTAVVFQHPLEVEHGRNLAEDLDLVLGDRAQGAAGIEDLEEDRRASAEEGAHQRLSLAADMRSGQIDQRTHSTVAAEKTAAHAHVLHGNIAVRKQGRLGRAG